jgi:hypothetical protein
MRYSDVCFLARLTACSVEKFIGPLNSDFELCGRKWKFPVLINHPDICLQGLRKTAKNLKRNRRFPDRDLKCGPPRYQSELIINTRNIRCYPGDRLAMLMFHDGLCSGRKACLLLVHYKRSPNSVACCEVPIDSADKLPQRRINNESQLNPKADFIHK